MATLIRLELVLLVLEGLAFAARYAWRSRWRSNPVGWLVMLWIMFGVIDVAGLAVLGTPMRPPLWVYAVVFGAEVIFGAWRFLLLVRYQR